MTVFRKFFLAFSIMLSLLGAGSLGFVWIEDYSWREAIYMTVITISTVGFMEVKELSPAGQWFTIGLIISSFGTFAYAIGQLTQAVISGELAAQLKKKRLEKKIDQLEGHVILCGFGRHGSQSYAKLRAYGQTVVVIERDAAVAKEHLNDEKILHLIGDATQDNSLKAAGVERASALVTTLTKDADNLFVAISAKALNPKIRIVSRASSESAEIKMRRLGIEAIVKPENVGGTHMASLVVNPYLVEFLEELSVEGNSKMNLTDLALKDLRPDVDSITIADLQLEEETGCMLLGLRKPEGSYLVNPPLDSLLQAETRLFVLGEAQQIKKLTKRKQKH